MEVHSHFEGSHRRGDLYSVVARFVTACVRFERQEYPSAQRQQCGETAVDEEASRAMTVRLSRVSFHVLLEN